jgi:hypothetical protein
MQNFSANQQKIEYALYTGMTDIMKDGKMTGEKQKTYTTPAPLWIYVSPAKGEAVVEPFGLNDEYTNLMSTSDTACPIKEDSILWIGISSQNSTPHNYRVTKVARGLNSILYAIKKVSVT